MFLKLLSWNLFFSLFLVPLNTLGQEISVCDRSDFIQELIREEQFGLKIIISEGDESSYNWSCEKVHLKLEDIERVTLLGKDWNIESFKDDFSGFINLERLRIEYDQIKNLPKERSSSIEKS